MPELPEVETIRRDLSRKILSKKITDIQIKRQKVVQNQTAYFKSVLIGSSFNKIKRVGKLLIFKIGNQKEDLLVHLKMTGQLIYQQGDKLTAGGHNWPPIEEKLPNKQTRVIFTFKDKSKLYFNDQRVFGYLKLVGSEQEKRIVEKFGIGPLTRAFTLEKFTEILKSRQGIIKAVLLNQEIIAGIGNIYADEICFYAKVKPTRKTNRLTKKEIKDLYAGCRTILKKAIKYRGTTFSNYVDAKGNKGNFTKLLKVYGRENQKCMRCRKGIIKKIKLNGRGTHYCSVCQK